MFRKLVSNLAFSPALVGQLGFYAKRLKKEEATRRIGLIFTALALIVQSFAVFSPPEPVNASSPSNFIPGGVSSVQDYLHHYDANTNNIKDLFKELGITRNDIAGAHQQQINSKDVYSWGLTSHFSYAKGERTYAVKTSSGGMRTFYYRPLDLWDSGSTVRTGSYYYAYVGKASSGPLKGQWFGLMKVCGNLVLKVVPPKPKCPTGTVGTYPDCTVPPKMCTIPGKENLPTNSPQCKPTPKCSIPGKGNLPANSPDCKYNPVAACESLKITKIADNYQLTATASADHGATIKGYVFVIKKDGKVIKTQTQSGSTYTYPQKSEGRYTVELTVSTSLGDKSGPDCIKTFSVAPPAMCPQNPAILASSPDCQPCPGDTTVWIKDEKCSASVIQTKTASNITQGNVDATTTTAKAGDKIIYTLNVSNHGLAAASVTPTEELLDVSEYATVIEKGAGVYDKDAKTLTWPTINLKPGETQTRMFTVQVLDTIPAMGQGVSDKTSYDCKMTNTFGNSVDINVECPVQKQFVEQTVAELPHTGPRENMLFAGAILTVVTYFYARARQVKKEIRLIRRDLNAGTI